jgi:RNA polymerase-binding transcription factor DksA
MANIEIFEYLTNKKNDLATRLQEIETLSFKEDTTIEQGLCFSSSELKQVEQKVELKAELRQVTEALSRMAIGEYGICVHCQQSINILRLQIQPCVKTCIHCSLT